MTELSELQERVVIGAVKDPSSVMEFYCDEQDLVLVFYDKNVDSLVKVVYSCDSVTPETCEYLFDSATGVRGSDAVLGVDPKAYSISITGQTEMGEQQKIVFTLDEVIESDK
jgi:hypothetical protein